MKNYKNEQNQLFAFELDCFDENGQVINEIVKEIIIEKSLIEITVEEYNAILESLKPCQSEIRKNEIYIELNNIDLLSIRPNRNINLGIGTDYDIQKLTELEDKATLLREELKKLSL